MPLDPQAEVYLAKLRSLQIPDFHTMGPPEARKLFRAMRGLAGKPDPIGAVHDEKLPHGIMSRVYRPLGATDGLLPALVFFHGGGWVLGDIETVDNLCRRLSNASGCVVVSVEYRVAPESRFPEPLNDCWQAVAWIGLRGESLGIDPARIAVGGDSAGGNLAAAVALKFRELGIGRPSSRTVEANSADLVVDGIATRQVRGLIFQLLIYPITEHSFASSSYRENAAGYGLSRDMMVWYWNQYLACPEDGRSPLASPMLETDLTGLPPALVITAGYDVLRDEGQAYARRLREAGVDVEEHHYPGMIHGFLQMSDSFDQGRLAIVETGRVLARTMFA